MDEKRILNLSFIDKNVVLVLLEMNKEIERLKRFAKNVDTFGGKKIYPDLVNISEDRK